MFLFEEVKVKRVFGGAECSQVTGQFRWLVMKTLPSDTLLPSSSSSSSSSSSPTIGLQSPGLQAEFLRGKLHKQNCNLGGTQSCIRPWRSCASVSSVPGQVSVQQWRRLVRLCFLPPAATLQSYPVLTTNPHVLAALSVLQQQTRFSWCLPVGLEPSQDCDDTDVSHPLGCPARLSLSSPELLTELRDSKTRSLRHVVRHSGMTTVFSGRGRGREQVGRQHWGVTKVLD